RMRSMDGAILEGVQEVGRAVFFLEVIIVFAVIPLFPMTGPEGALFGPMANTYAFAICGALMLAVTLTPVLCSFLFTNKKEEKETWMDRLMKRGYLRALSTMLRHRVAALAVMGALVFGSCVFIPHLGGAVMPAQ